MRGTQDALSWVESTAGFRLKSANTLRGLQQKLDLHCIERKYDAASIRTIQNACANLSSYATAIDGDSRMNSLSHQLHPQSRTDAADSIEARLSIGS